MVLTPSRSVLHCAPIRLQAFVTQQAPVGKTPAMATVSGLTGHCTVLEESSSRLSVQKQPQTQIKSCVLEGDRLGSLLRLLPVFQSGPSCSSSLFASQSSRGRRGREAVGQIPWTGDAHDETTHKFFEVRINGGFIAVLKATCAW